VRELPSGGAGLRQQLGNRRLQQFLENRNAGSSGNGGCAARALPLRRRRDLGTVIEEPRRVALEHAGEQLQRLCADGVRLPLSIMLR
jgi:hypothetical protein